MSMVVKGVDFILSDIFPDRDMSENAPSEGWREEQTSHTGTCEGLEAGSGVCSPEGSSRVEPREPA